ncbi:MAG: 4-(cytidine 5'-diphospho)-2-C-methyl-D-erythritol kinase [Myxococcota bacterium]
MLQLHAPAKLNLGLRILGRRPDGYHEIETVLVPLRLFDRIEIEREPGAGLALHLSGPGSAELPRDRSNLAVRAAERLCTELGLAPELRLRLMKGIPVAAGLGGGSSDAAAVLLGIEQLSGKRLDAPARAALALELGADVPFFLDPRPSLARGVGDRLEPLAGVPEMWWVLVAFRFGVATAEAYRAASTELTLPRQGSSIAALLGASGLTVSPPNDLEAVVARRHPQIGEARRRLEEAGAIATGMSGSGPTVFGRFPDRGAAEAAAGRVRLPEGAVTMTVSSPGSATRDWGWGVAKW